MNENTIAGLDELSVNFWLANWINSRGLDLSGETSGMQGCFSLESHDTELLCWVMFEGDYSCNCIGSKPLFARSHDSFCLIWNVMNELERKKFSYILGQQIGFSFIRYLGATPAQKCEAALLALGLGKAP